MSARKLPVLVVVAAASLGAFFFLAEGPGASPVSPPRASPPRELLAPSVKLEPGAFPLAATPASETSAATSAESKIEASGRGASAISSTGSSGESARPSGAPPSHPASRTGLTRLDVVVVDPSGKPVEGALVSGEMAKRRFKPRRTVKGEVAIESREVGLEEAAPSRLFVRHARFGRQGPFDVSPSSRPVKVELERVPTGVLSGKIHGHDGAGVAKPILTVLTPRNFATRLGPADFLQWSEKDGRFKVELVPGEYRVRASAPGFCPTEPARVVLSAGATREADFLLERAATLSGAITLPQDLDDGKEHALDIELESNADRPNGAVTELRRVRVQGGAYRIGEVRPGWHRLRATDLRHLGPWATVEVRDGEPIENLTLHLDPPSDFPLVRGRVVLDPDDEPAADASVLTTGARADTADDGTFALRLDEGRHYGLDIEYEGYWSPPVSVFVPPRGQGSPREVRVKLLPLD